MASRAIWVTHRGRYDRMLAPFDAPLLDAASPQPGEAVIDVGCGTGTTTLQVAARVGTGGHVLGIDTSEHVTELARQRLADAAVGHATVVTADAATYAYPPNGADLLISRFATMLFPNGLAGHRHLINALRPGGRLATVVWQSLERNLWHALPLRAVQAHIDLSRAGPAGGPGPFALSDPEQLRAMLDSAGFVDIAIEAIEAPVWVGTDPPDAIAFFDDDAGHNLRNLANPETVARIYDELALLLQPYASDEGVVVPSAAWLTTARRGAVASG